MCSITCANTSLPWFIDHPREVVLRRVAEPASAVQIETKINHHLLTYDQHFKKPNCRNVGTLLIYGVNRCINGPPSLVQARQDSPGSLRFPYVRTIGPS